MEYTDFESFIEQSTAYLRACNAKASHTFGIGTCARCEYDLFCNEIWWSEPSAPKVRGRVTVVGTTSKSSGTWLWAWANPHFEDVEIGPIEKVREYGATEGISKLTESQWSADEVDGWEMTAVAARLLESQGAYCSPSGNGSFFLLFDRLEFIPEEERSRYMPLKRKDADVDPSGRGSNQQ